MKLLFGFVILFGFISCGTTKIVREDRVIHSDERSLIIEAERLIGSPYKYAGTTPRGFDCSGFTSYVFDKAINKKLLRTSKLQATMGRKINLKQVRAGDLIFFKLKPGSKINHVSLVVENQNDKILVVHATSSRGVIKEDINKSSYWIPKIAFARRIL